MLHVLSLEMSSILISVPLILIVAEIGFVMIAESHISFHTFPAHGFVTIDLYTCQNDVDKDKICSRLIQAFGIGDADVYIQDRGLRYPAADII